MDFMTSGGLNEKLEVSVPSSNSIILIFFFLFACVYPGTTRGTLKMTLFSEVSLFNLTYGLTGSNTFGLNHNLSKIFFIFVGYNMCGFKIFWGNC